MTRPVILVTGSRVLADVRGADTFVAGALAVVGGRESLVYVGDAAGPDAWAAGWSGYHARVFGLDGTVRTWDPVLRPPARGRWDRAADGTAVVPVGFDARDLELPTRRPLVRNAVMVLAATAAAERSGARLLAVGFVAKWSKTRGTDQTLDRAARAGADVWRLELPGFLGTEKG